MDQNESGFKYDVAISFLAGDEHLAVHLADSLRERMRVFVYSEQQKELAGKDGLEQFTAVFRSQARVCVVLYREGWGQTKWTRVEETAIKDRAFEHGWDFLTIVGLSSVGPIWLPKTKLWLGYERFGLAGASAVIDARVKEQGGDPHEESAVERAQRMVRARDAEQERRNFLQGQDGVDAARAEVLALEAYFKEGAEALSPVIAPRDVVHSTRVPRDWFFALGTPGAGLTVCWMATYSNSLHEAYLEVREFNQNVRVDGNTIRERKVVAQHHYEFTRAEGGALGWVPIRKAKPVLSTKQLAELFLKRFVERALLPRRI